MMCMFIFFLNHPLSAFLLIFPLPTHSRFDSCPNANIASKAMPGEPKVRAWVSKYLADAVSRFNAMAPEVKWTTEDVYAAQKVGQMSSGVCETSEVAHAWDAVLVDVPVRDGRFRIFQVLRVIYERGMGRVRLLVSSYYCSYLTANNA